MVTWATTKGCLAPCLLALLSATMVWSDTPPENSEATSDLPTGTLSLSLTWVDSYGLLQQGHNSMTKEVSKIFEEIGVEVIWKEASAELEQPHHSIVLRPNSSDGWNLPASAMGVAPGSGTPGCAVYIFLPNVIRALGASYQPGRVASARDVKELSRALGRVVAHELVHAIAPDAPHTEEGLMQAWLNRNTLLQKGLTMTAATARAVRASLAAH